MSRPLHLSSLAARALARRAVLLDQSASTVGAALHYFGYIQLDPLNICGRMQDLILRNRVRAYEEDALTRHIHGQPVAPGNARRPRGGFEHYIPSAGILAAWPLDAYPYVRAYLERIHPTTTRRPLSIEEEQLAQHFLRVIADRGASSSDDFEHEGRAKTGWGTSGRLVKVVLEKLFASGRLLITERRGFRRVYDLPSRVLPELAMDTLPSEVDLRRWLAQLRLRQRRVVALRRADRDLIGEQLQEIRVENGPTLYCFRHDTDLLDQADPPASPKPLLLAPLDPLIYDRKVTRALWNFDFTWEVYTPAVARQRGYYSLPVLSGLEIVGDVEPKSDRKRGKLIVHSRRVKRGHHTSEAVRELAAFLRLRTA